MSYGSLDVSLQDDTHTEGFGIRKGAPARSQSDEARAAPPTSKRRRAATLEGVAEFLLSFAVLGA